MSPRRALKAAIAAIPPTVINAAITGVTMSAIARALSGSRGLRASGGASRAGCSSRSSLSAAGRCSAVSTDPSDVMANPLANAARTVGGRAVVQGSTLLSSLATICALPMVVMRFIHVADRQPGCRCRGVTALSNNAGATPRQVRKLSRRDRRVCPASRPRATAAGTIEASLAANAKNPGAEAPGSLLVLPAGWLAQPLIRRCLIVGSDPYGLMLLSGRRLFRISRTLPLLAPERAVPLPS